MSAIVRVFVLLVIVSQTDCEVQIRAEFDHQSCIRVGDTVSFTCSVEDTQNPNDVTKWKGSEVIFNCPKELESSIDHNQLVLRHSAYDPNEEISASKCGKHVEGNIQSYEDTASSVRIYTSTLTITNTTLNMDKGEVKCTNLNNRESEPIILLTEALPHPPNLTVSFPTPDTFKLTWSRDNSTIRSINYTFEVSNGTDCGNCTINATSVSCIGWGNDSQVCNITVKAVVPECAGFESAQLYSVSMKPPEAPELLSVMPVYSAEERKLQRVNTKVLTNGAFDRNGFPIEYEVALIPETSDFNCSIEPKVIDEHMCENGNHDQGKATCNVTLVLHSCQLIETAEIESLHLYISTSATVLSGLRSDISHNQSIAFLNRISQAVQLVSTESLNILLLEFSQIHDHIFAQIGYGATCDGVPMLDITSRNTSIVRFCIPKAGVNCYLIAVTNSSQLSIGINGYFPSSGADMEGHIDAGILIVTGILAVMILSYI